MPFQCRIFLQLFGKLSCILVTVLQKVFDVQLDSFAVPVGMCMQNIAPLEIMALCAIHCHVTFSENPVAAYSPDVQPSDPH